MYTLSLFLTVITFMDSSAVDTKSVPLVINTWGFTNANQNGLFTKLFCYLKALHNSIKHMT